MASAFGQSPAASGDPLTAAIIGGTSLAQTIIAGKSANKAVKSNSGLILGIAGIGAVVVVGGIIGLVLLTRR